MSVTGTQLASHFQSQAASFSRVVEGYSGLVSELREAQKQVILQRAEARRELARVYLGELSDAAFARVAQLTGFKGFERRDPRQALAHERKVLQHAIAEIEGEPRFARRDELVGPAGTLTQELENAKTTLEPLEAECQRFESQPGFLELVHIGYDTPQFTSKWWQASYWKEWATGDRICKALGMGDFGDDVLPAYRKVAEPRNFMRDEVKRITAQIDAVHELVQKRDAAQDRLAHLDETYLAEAQEYLGEHLELADAGLLEQWAAADPSILRAVQMGLRKLAGLAAKRTFLQDIEDGIGTQIIKPLEERVQKARQKQSKFARPKHAYADFPTTLIDDTVKTKVERLHDQREKLRRRSQQLVASQNYGGFDLRNDSELWWVYFVNSAPPRLAPNLHGYYQAHPNAAPVVDDEPVDVGPSAAEAAAVAFAAGNLERETYLS